MKQTKFASKVLNEKGLSLYNELKNLCQQEGITIEKLCELVTGNKKELENWKRNDITDIHFAKCADELKFSADEFLGFHYEHKDILLARKTAKKLEQNTNIEITYIEQILNTNYATFRAWCSGHGYYFNDKLFIIASLFEVTVSDLIGGTDFRNNLNKDNLPASNSKLIAHGGDVKSKPKKVKTELT